MNEIRDLIGETGLLPILPITDIEDAKPVCEALLAGGARTVEVVLRNAVAVEAVGKIAATFPEMIVGVGTVISAEQVERMMDAGARFVVNPGFDKTLVEFCQRRGAPVLPGCTTASETQQAVACGLDMLKFFPAFESGGVDMMRQLNGPFPQIHFVPTGSGMTCVKALELLAYGNVRAVGGAWMFLGDDALKRKDYKAITASVKTSLEKIKALKQGVLK